MNHEAQPLQLHEAKAISSDPACMLRALRSYELILRFYGMKLVNSSTGAQIHSLCVMLPVF
jgi:hypothetical protein